MNSKCENCKHWDKSDSEYEISKQGNPLGRCNLSLYYEGSKEISDNQIGYCDYEGYSATLLVGKDFGCILFEGKE